MKKRLKASSLKFLKEVKDAIRHYDMLHKGDRVLAAVSGGADSVCLLKALLEVRESLQVEVIAANMDHGLRGKESERDSAFVKDLAKKLGVKCAYKKVDVRRAGKKGASLEEKARRARYAFLFQEAEKNKCNVIATGHTMNDQAETVLMKMIYGSALAGLTGIPPVRDEKGVRVIRPLIRTEREQIIKFLKENNLKFIEDSSNLDVSFLRNKIRLKVMPYLEKCNPRLKRTLANLSDTLREDFGFINDQKKIALKSQTSSIKTKDIILQPKALRKALFKELIIRAGGDVKGLTYRHWMDMDYFLRAAGKNKSLDFPGDIRVTKSGSELIFKKRKG